MKKFITATALFMIPVLLVVLLTYCVLVSSNETATAQDILDADANGTLKLYGFAYHEDTRALKYTFASQKKASLLVLGTSRSMQFRGGFFTQPNFYNAGGGIIYGSDIEPFLRAMPQDALPDNLLVVLDQYFYNKEYCYIDDERDTKPYLFNEKTNISWNMLRETMLNWFNKHFSITQALTKKEGVFGLSANAKNAGFYPDGSYSYGTQAENPNQTSAENLFDVNKRVQFSTNRFEYSDDVYDDMIFRTKQLLDFCDANNIKVTAILPPYAPSVWQNMEATGHYGYIEKLYPALQTAFEGHNAEIFDFTYMPETTDDEYIDGFHGSDRVYAEICVRLADESQYLSEYIDKQKCQTLVEAPGAPRTVDFTAFSQ